MGVGMEMAPIEGDLSSAVTMVDMAVGFDASRTEETSQKYGSIMSSDSGQKYGSVLGSDSERSASLSPKWISYSILMAVAAVYGTSFGCVKVLEGSMDEKMAASLRFSLAGLTFMPYLLSLKKGE